MHDCAMHSTPFGHSALVSQNCASAQLGRWQTVDAVSAARSYWPQQTSPLGQSVTPPQWNVATSVPQDTLLPLRQ
jgi:hypothetical protein